MNGIDNEVAVIVNRKVRTYCMNNTVQIDRASHETLLAYTNFQSCFPCWSEKSIFKTLKYWDTYWFQS